MSEAQMGDVLVLHVDDEQGFSELVASYLERENAGFEVVTAENAEDALAVLDDGEIDCVVSDFEMPGRDGLELLRTVRERYGDVPFVLFTGKGSEEIASEAISAGVDDYLQKGSGSEQYTILANRVANLVSRRRATDAAAQSEERYHNLVDTAPTSIGLFDREGELLYANDAAADLLGYEDPSAMEGKRMPEFVHPEDRETALERFERLHREGEPAPEAEMRLVSADGEVRHVTVASAPGVYRGESVAQAALKELPPDATVDDAGGAEEDDEALMWRALDSLEDAFYVLDEHGTLRLWNHRVNELTGCSDEELAGADPMQFFVDEERDAVVDSIERVLATGSGVVEAEVATTAGPVPFEFRGHRLTDGDGTVVGLAGIGRNVTERRRRERALRELNAFAADIAEFGEVERVCDRAVAAAEAVLEFDRSVINIEEDGRLPIAAASSEVPPDGATEMSVEEGLAGLTYREGRSFLVEDVTEHPEADPQGPYRAAVSVPIGEYGVLQAVDEEPGGFDESDRELAELLAAHCAAALDRIEREATLQEQNERLGEFASLVSHDLRNPLTLLQTSIDLLRETGDESHIDDCERAVHQMDDLIEDVLTLAREGQVVEAVDAVALESVVRETWDGIAPDAATLSVEEGITVSADPDRLRQAVENLVRNAVEHAGDDVTVTVGALEGAAGFYVADDGPGIPEDSADRVFEPGFTTSEEGTGFGLRIVREIVEAHGWTIDVTESETGGARFEVRTGE